MPLSRSFIGLRAPSSGRSVEQNMRSLNTTSPEDFCFTDFLWNDCLSMLRRRSSASMLIDSESSVVALVVTSAQLAVRFSKLALSRRRQSSCPGTCRYCCCCLFDFCCWARMYSLCVGNALIVWLAKRKQFKRSAKLSFAAGCG